METKKKIENRELLLMVFYFAVFVFISTDYGRNKLLKLASREFWIKYSDVLLYSSFAIAWIMLSKDKLIRSLKNFIKTPKIYLKQCEWIGGITLVAMVATAIILSRFSIGDSPNQQAVDRTMESNMAMYTPVVCIIGPFVEEMVFHGTLYEQIRKKQKSKMGVLITILGVAIFFALYHYGFINIFKPDYYVHFIEYLPVFVTGIGLTFLYEKTCNIFAPILVHMCINMIAAFG